MTAPETTTPPSRFTLASGLGLQFAHHDGLLPVIVRDESGEVLMFAWMNEESLAMTLREGRACYFSRSRGRLWRKGELSGHIQSLVELRLDCDADCLLMTVRQEGVACHDGYRSCFYRFWDGNVWLVDQPRLVDPLTVYPAAAKTTAPEPFTPFSRHSSLTENTNPMDHEQRLESFGWTLPPAPKPMGLYRPLVITGSLAFLSGHGPLRPDKTLVTGRVGAGIELSEAQEAARWTGLGMLATLREGLGSLNRVVRLVKVLGMVNCIPEFDQQPAVINGCSQVFADVFGTEAGIGARSAVGVGSLPSGMVVEVEAIFEIVP